MKVEVDESGNIQLGKGVIVLVLLGLEEGKNEGGRTIGQIGVGIVIGGK